MTAKQLKEFIGKSVRVRCVDSMASQIRAHEPPQDLSLSKRRVFGVLIYVDDDKAVICSDMPDTDEDDYQEYDATIIHPACIMECRVRGKK